MPIDPITSGIISGLVVNALTGLAGPVGRIATKNKTKISEKSLERLDVRSRALVTSLLAELKEQQCPSTDTTKLAKFLQTEDAQVYTRTVMAATFANRVQDFEAPLKAQLVALLSLVARVDSSNAENYADPIFGVLASACAAAVSEIQRIAPTQFVTMRLLASFEVQAGTLRALQDTTSLLKQRSTNELAAIYRFVREYRREAHRRHGYIIPPHLDDKRRVPINKLYIMPRFETNDARFQRITSSQSRPQSSEALTITLDRMLRRVYRTVVLGDPGAGKSTLAKKLVHEFSETGASDNELCVPFLVTLRDYASYKHEKNASILQYIEGYVNAEYQIPTPPGAVEYLLASGRAFVIFDGLDELLETHRRREITDNVESFASLYPYISIVVTSRRVGYRQAPLDEEVFGVLELSDLDDESIADYVTKWFALDDTLSKRRQNELTHSFLEESLSVHDLRSNPLMLGLLCNVYRGERSIPRSRADLYEKCALMLFERWDASRGIVHSGIWSSDVKSALQHLALWAFSSDRSSGIRHRVLVAKVRDYLLETRYEDAGQAEEAARQFIELWRGRAWVLTDTGTTESGESLYQFTHRTFLEYFAAVQLVRTNPTPEALWRQLDPHLKERSWDVIAQLAIQIAEHNSEGARDQLFGLLLQSAQRATFVERLDLVSFASRYLDILNPSPRICRAVARACLEVFLEIHRAWPTIPAYEIYIQEQREAISPSAARDDIDLEIQVDDIMDPLLTLMAMEDDAGHYARDEITRHVISLAEAEDPDLACRAIVFMLGLEEIWSSESITSRLHAESFALEGISKVRQETQRLLQAPAASNAWVSLAAARRSKISIQQLVQWCGLNVLFIRIPEYSYGGHDLVPSLGEQLLEKILDCGNGQPGLTNQDLRDIDAVAKAFRIRFAKAKRGGNAGFDPDWLSIDFADTPKLYERIVSFTDSPDDDYAYLDREEPEDYYPGYEYDESYYSRRKAVFKSARKDNRGRSLPSIPPEREADVLFCGAMLLCAFTELEKWSLTSEDGQVPEFALGALQPIELILLASSTFKYRYVLESKVFKVGLWDEDIAILRGWATGQFSFVD